MSLSPFVTTYRSVAFKVNKLRSCPSGHKPLYLRNFIGYVFVIQFVAQFFCQMNGMDVLRVPAWI